ncbi:MAG: 3-phosphoshikimate 1-carboxyvinyltransferase [Ruminococcaceae bacterium]|nr:3-phosphoshikimate 1-carboxyvinyltransferase [Oscillospiraceae bacterium]
MIIKPSSRLRGEIVVPGDKSISHRAVMLGALANGKTSITGFLNGADCLSTIDCFAKMGICIDINDTTVTVNGKGMHSLSAPSKTLYTGNSGTTTRLLAGILSAQEFDSVIDGDFSIRKRPMKRIREPLSLMGADISSDFCPLYIKGRKLHGISYTLPVASAQLKSSIILAAMYADSETTIIQPQQSRNHTELMLSHMGANITTSNNTITILPTENLHAQDITVPADISSAAFFMVAASIVPNSQITLLNVGINETRSGILDILLQMGADIKLENERYFGFEKVCDMTISSAPLHACTIEGDIIGRLIDEIPIIAVAAAFASGTTIIKDATELKVKESNRLDAVVCELKRAGVDITATDDGMIINGKNEVRGADFLTYNDHRMAMSMAVLALAAKGESTIENPHVVDISFPNFFEVLSSLDK